MHFPVIDLCVFSNPCWSRSSIIIPKHKCVSKKVFGGGFWTYVMRSFELNVLILKSKVLFTEELALVLFQELKKMWSSSYLLICFALHALHWGNFSFSQQIMRWWLLVQCQKITHISKDYLVCDSALTCVCACVRTCVCVCESYVLSGKWEDSRQLLLIRCGFLCLMQSCCTWF